MQLRIRLLGQFGVTVDGRPLPKLAGARLQSLFAYLVLRAQAPQSRSHLAYLFWPDSDESNARNNLRQLLYQLREAMGEAERCVRTTANSVQWAPPEPCFIDAAALEEALAEAEMAGASGDAPRRRSALERSLASCGGPLVPSCYDDWIVPEREALARRCKRAAGQLVELVEATREWELAIPHVAHRLGHDPIDEEAYRCLMRLYARCNDRAAALLVFRECQKALRREVDAEPSEQTLRLHEWIKAEDETLIAGEPAPRVSLPLQATSFLGRDAEVGEIAELLRKYRLVTVTGAGGIGKTRVALAAGSEQQAGDSGCGAWFVDLAPLRDANLVTTAIASALGVQESPKHPLLETILTYVKDKHALIILDNCEHVIGEAARVAEALLRGAPLVRMLATSREALKVAGENVYRLPPLGAPRLEATRGIGTAEAAAYGAVVLFAERARAADHRFSLTDENAPDVAEICRQLDGIPLAIELAAARVTILPVAALAGKLGQRFALLGAGGRMALPRQQTMSATIDWSYDLLSQAEQRLFEHLSIFAGGCTLATAAAVSSDRGSSELDVLELLSSLLDKSLVVAEMDVPAPRYRILEPFRQYALERLAARGEQTAVARRHALAYLDVAERLEREYDTTPDRSWRACARVELENWRAALEWALVARSDVVLGARLAAAMEPVWYNFALPEGRRWLRVAFGLVDEQTPADVVARLESSEACTAARLMEHDASQAAALRALARYVQLGDRSGIAQAQWLVGRSLVVPGRPEHGEPLLREALESARALGRNRLAGEALISLAYARSMGGDCAGARATYSEALALWSALGSERGVARAAGNLAEAEFLAGDADIALKIASDAVGIARAQDDLLLVTWMLANMAAYLVALDRYDDARTHAREALEIARRFQFDMYVAWALQHLAAVAALEPHGDEAVTAQKRKRAAQLLGFVDARYAALASPREHTEQQECDRILAALRESIDPDALALLLSRGAAFAEDEAIEAALREA
ncbi:MAG: BTAD domain-containing putative transcriptional regulator [Vulcanimicrobiaceae bacterium]